MSTDPRAAIAAADTALGIEFGSTRIKAVLIGPDHEVLATGGHGWENHLEGGLWSYTLDEVVAGLQSAYASLVADVRERYDVTPTSYGSIGISAMMHGYLAFDADDNLLAPFRTWRNTNTGRAADELTHPANRPVERIDYVWLSPDLGASGFSAADSTASDHRALSVTVRPR